MNRYIAAAATVAVLALSACSAQPTPETAPAPTSESVPVESAPTPEENARTVAISMDPIFADDATWATALSVAKSYCNLATEAGPDAAWDIMVTQSVEAGVSGEQMGILVGIGQNLYCPEFLQ